MCPEPDDSIPGDPVHGEFVGEVQTRWIHGGEDRDMALTADFTYVDAQGKPWTAPAGYRVNGASIPVAFWSVVGSPYIGGYRRASVVHDYYCEHPHGQSSKAVHRMFHEACLAGGVGKVKARLMYAAILAGGPSFDGDPGLEAFALVGGATDHPLTPDSEAWQRVVNEVNQQDAAVDLDKLDAVIAAERAGKVTG